MSVQSKINLPEILVMGDGIAGRAMALAWAQSGGSAKIVAPSHLSSALKGGVQLASNGWTALKTLGLDDAVKAIASPLSMMRLMSCETGNTLVQIDLNTPARRPYTGIARQGLMDVLGNACTKSGSITWHDGTIQQLANGPNNKDNDKESATLTLDDGTVLTAPYLFGADGAMGIARQFVKAEPISHQPVETRLAFRLTVPLDDLPHYFAAKSTSVWLGDGAHMVFYPLHSGDLNIVLVTTAGTSAQRQAMALLNAQPLLAPLIPYLEKITPLPLYRHAPLDVLRRGRVLLCGDAAHPMPPHLAQGAGQSLIDAAQLKSMLAFHGADGHDLNACFTNWSSSRLKAVNNIQQKADRAGRLFSLDGPLAKLRNFGLSTVGGFAMEAELDKIWRH